MHFFHFNTSRRLTLAATAALSLILLCPCAAEVLPDGTIHEKSGTSESWSNPYGSVTIDLDLNSYGTAFDTILVDCDAYGARSSASDAATTASASASAGPLVSGEVSTVNAPSNRAWAFVRYSNVRKIAGRWVAASAETRGPNETRTDVDLGAGLLKCVAAGGVSGDDIIDSTAARVSLSFPLSAGKSLTVVATAGGSVTGSSTGVPSGSAVSITAVADTGYTFTGWTRTNGTEGSFASAAAAATSYTMGSDDVTVTASFTRDRASFRKPPFVGAMDSGASPAASLNIAPAKIDKGNTAVAAWSRSNSDTSAAPSCGQPGAPAFTASGASVTFATAGIFTYSLSAEATKPSATVEWEAEDAAKVALSGPGGFSYEGPAAGAVVVFTSGTYSAVADGPGGTSAPATVVVTLPAIPATVTVTASVEVVAPTTATPKVTLQSLDGDQGTVSLNKAR